jgi:hypothetical protein
MNYRPCQSKRQIVPEEQSCVILAITIGARWYGDYGVSMDVQFIVGDADHNCCSVYRCGHSDLPVVMSSLVQALLSQANSRSIALEIDCVVKKLIRFAITDDHHLYVG